MAYFHVLSYVYTSVSDAVTGILLMCLLLSETSKEENSKWVIKLRVPYQNNSGLTDSFRLSISHEATVRAQ